MKSFLNKIRDTTARSTAAGARSTAADNDSYLGTTSSSSHASTSGSVSSSKSARRTRSHTQPTKLSKAALAAAARKEQPPPPLPSLQHDLPPLPTSHSMDSSATSTSTLPATRNPALPRSTGQLFTEPPASHDYGSVRSTMTAVSTGLVGSADTRVQHGMRRSLSSAPSAAGTGDLMSSLTEARRPSTKGHHVRSSRSFRENGSKTRDAVPGSMSASTDMTASTIPADGSSSYEVASTDDGLASTSGFSSITMLSNATADRSPGVRLDRRLPHPDGPEEVLIKGADHLPSKSVNPPALSISADDSTLYSPSGMQVQSQPATAQGAARPSTKSRAKSVLQRLRRPLTAGSAGVSDSRASSGALPRLGGFGFNQTAPAATTAPTQPALVSEATIAAPSKAYPALVLESRGMGVPAAVASVTTAPSTLRSNEDASANELNTLLSELTNAGTAQLETRRPSLIADTASKIIGWAEQVAAQDRRPSVTTTSSRSLLRSIEHLEVMVESQLARSGTSLSVSTHVGTAFEHAKHLCTPIAAPTTPVSSELSSDIFHTGFATSALNGHGGLPLTPSSSHTFSPRDLPSKVDATLPAALKTFPTPDTILDPSSALEALADPVVEPLFPAPRRRRRPLTAPETGAPAFGGSPRRPSTQPVATAEGEDAKGLVNHASSASLVRRGSTAAGTQEVFTPEAFRATSRPTSRGGVINASASTLSTNHGLTTTGSGVFNTSESQRSIAPPPFGSSMVASASHHLSHNLAPSPSSTGLGIRVTGHDDASANHVGVASLRTKLSRASVRDGREAKPQPKQHDRVRQHRHAVSNADRHHFVGLATAAS